MTDNPSGQITLPGQATKKLSQGEAGFRKGGGMQNLMCGNCRYFSQGACSQVDVSPEPGDYCDEFATPLNDGRTPSATGALTVLSKPGHLDLFINRVAEDPQTGVRRWFATSSGTKKDAYGEYMTVGLFKDFIRRAERREKPPEMFASRAWRGGLPYLGVAHYLDLEGVGIVGDTEQIYIDGDVLKAKGVWRDTPLAKRAFDAVQRDISENVPSERRVRISIAFVDWAHDHKGVGQFVRKALTDACELCSKGVGEKFYKQGHLVHLALTRRPAYVETEIALEERSMTDKRDDAASIVGDELADELEKRAKASLTARSAEAVAAGAIVVRQEEEAPPGGQEGEPEKPEEEKDEEDKKKEEEEEAPESTEAFAEESYLGGAKTLDEAEAFLVRSGKPPLMDSWAVLGGVLANIAGSGKAPAIQGVLSDFQRTLDQMTVRTLSEVMQFLKASAAAQAKAPPAPPVATATEPVAYQSHVLDEALTKFRSSYDEAMATPVDANNRLSMIQPAMDALGDAVMRNVVETTVSASPSATAVAPAGINREEVAQVVAEQIAPIRAMVEQLTQTLKAPALDTRSRVPAPRGLTVAQERVPGQPLTTRSGIPPAPEAKPNSIRAIARRSVGLVD